MERQVMEMRSTRTCMSLTLWRSRTTSTICYLLSILGDEHLCRNALDDSLRDLSNPQATLQLFKQRYVTNTSAFCVRSLIFGFRNAMLRSGLRYLSSSMSPQNISS
ncbi:hypothetical protein SISNIDRAFT_101613 [Sistotremastrum niveocremeum HHB9708]|uniref:Uncharacterized protein n=1 Tax=Sistotremastrum niveocremeum HHB9708 TaxID=1314777 RepID=A0A164UD91_9AGAM|nr:hypothetical protein SISNIDRAFT_101613 [Sistotremastrum niveocremeum HHB9708]